MAGVEKYTERARQVVVFAQEEARALKHNYTGTEHLLLGLLREQEGIGARVIGSLGLTVDQARREVTRIVGGGEESGAGQIPSTPRAKQVLELALREALFLGHTYVGTEHILLGLVRENEGVAAQILLDLGGDAETVRDTVIRTLSEPTVSVTTPTPEARSKLVGLGRDPAWIGELDPTLTQLVDEIRTGLGREPDAGDLLLALACAPGTVPAMALEALGVDLDALWGALERARSHAVELRKQAEFARRQLRQQISEVRNAKTQAIEAQQFERAAELRDQERELRETQAPVVTPGSSSDETLDRIRVRLGLPPTDGPPHPTRPI